MTALDTVGKSEPHIAYQLAVDKLNRITDRDIEDWWLRRIFQRRPSPSTSGGRDD